MTLEYAPRGLVGVLTPQANTTVEPEMQALWPAGVSMITARMTSQRPTIEERLVDYYQRLDEAAGQFGNAPLQVLAAACTGSSYLIGPAQEDTLFGELSARLGLPVTNSALAVVAALRALGVRRVGLVSPYPSSLTERSVAYWRSRNLEVLRVAVTEAVSAPAFHPIYALTAEATRRAIQTLRGTPGLEAVVLLGTGTPTLAAMASEPTVDGAPVFSCNLALAWHSVALLTPRQPPAGSDLLALVQDPHWRETLARRLQAP